jgi:hypothetical protein
MRLSAEHFDAEHAFAQGRRAVVGERVFDDTDEQELTALTGLERGARDQPVELRAHGLGRRAGRGHRVKVASQYYVKSCKTRFNLLVNPHTH